MSTKITCVSRVDGDHLVHRTFDHEAQHWTKEARLPFMFMGLDFTQDERSTFASQLHDDYVKSIIWILTNFGKLKPQHEDQD
jgi:hypothetical protein